MLRTVIAIGLILHIEIIIALTMNLNEHYERLLDKSEEE